MNKNLGMFRPQIIAGMKIVEGSQLIDMDEETFDALIDYGNTLRTKEKIEDIVDCD